MAIEAMPALGRTGVADRRRCGCASIQCAMSIQRAIVVAAAMLAELVVVQ